MRLDAIGTAQPFLEGELQAPFRDFVIAFLVVLHAFRQVVLPA